MRLIPLVVLAALSGTPGLAAPALTGHTCQIRGEVVDVSTRQVRRDPDWARSWGISRTTHYTDVTIRPIEVSHLEDGFDASCSGEVQTFQLGDEAAPETGSCITATARSGGDEFRNGTWLTEIRPADCD
jgi:hypothetical protein